MLDTLEPMEGFLQIMRKHKITGKIDIVHTQKNLITYEATNLMARAIAGQNTSYVNRVAIQYFLDNSGKTDNDDPGLTPERTDRIPDLTTVDIGTITIPVLTNVFSGIPTINTDPVKLIQNANTVTFHAAIDDDNASAMQSKFMVGAGLVGVSAGLDVLFAHQYVPLIEKLQFYQLLINWTIRFS